MELQDCIPLIVSAAIMQHSQPLGDRKTQAFYPESPSQPSNTGFYWVHSSAFLTLCGISDGLFVPVQYFKYPSCASKYVKHRIPP